jgi:hypothetical protein
VAAFLAATAVACQWTPSQTIAGLLDPKTWKWQGTFSWFAVLAGVAVHFIVDTAKQAQSPGAAPAGFNVGHLSYRIDAHVGLMLFKLAMMLIAFFGLIALDTTSATPFNMFLGGYSLDSFVSIVAGNLDRRAAARSAAMSKEPGLEAAPSL